MAYVNERQLTSKVNLVRFLLKPGLKTTRGSSTVSTNLFPAPTFRPDIQSRHVEMPPKLAGAYKVSPELKAQWLLSSFEEGNGQDS
jgi:hypothetical protein